MRTLVAIDPGQNGGIAYNIRHCDGRIEEGVIVMPATTKEIIEHLEIMKCHDENIIYLEDVGVMPSQGIVSAKTFMEHQGGLKAIALCLRYKLIMVKPMVWQKHFGLLSHKDANGKKESKISHKKRIIAWVQPRYPQIAWIDKYENYKEAVADALAILEYAKEKEK